jgi:glycerol-3-phosphate acyltransferase PlsY
MGILLVWRHRDNVNRLIAGTESKLGAKKSQTNLEHADKKSASVK